MAWKPIQPKQTGPGPFARAIISRLASLALAMILLFVAYTFLSAANRIRHDAATYASEQVDRNAAAQNLQTRRQGILVPASIGLIVGGIGLIALAGALLPSRCFEWFIRPPGDPRGRIAAPRDFLSGWP